MAKKAKSEEGEKGEKGQSEEVGALARRRFRPSSSPSAPFRKGSSMTKLMSKSELIQKVADQHSLSKKEVKGVIESLASVGYKELKKNGALSYGHLRRPAVV